jgi:hypothetical protein
MKDFPVGRWVKTLGIASTFAALSACAASPQAIPDEGRTPATNASAAESTEDAAARENAVRSIEEAATNSACAKHRFGNGRGVLPVGFYQSLALTYAKAVCAPARSNVVATGAAVSNDSRKDALAWYADRFAALGMRNDVAGAGVVRHVYALLPGLAAMESSGRYCCGRDRSANFSTAESAEAGTFQTSWGASSSHASLPGLFAVYQNDKSCFLEQARRGWRWETYCAGWNERNWGDPEETGYKWQALTKSCPAFAFEYAAVVVRYNGGSKGEFGPLRKKQVELVGECDTMLSNVADLVARHRSVCDAL